MKKLRSVLKLLRPKHWIKNLFVLAPLFFSGRFNEPDSNLRTAVAFVAFCLISSTTYVFNDIRDIEADRAHPKKSKSRPLAAGELSKITAWVVYGALMLATIALTIWFPMLLAVIGLYFFMNMAYSLYLKRLAVIELFVIATGFVLRVYSGAASIEVPVSKWMFVTTFSLALFLAATKRYQELKTNGDSSRVVLKQYTPEFTSRVAEISGTLAVVFFSLFTLTSETGFIFAIPVVIFALMRYWFVSDQSGAGESPTDLVLKDKQLLIAALLLIVISLLVLSHKFAG